MTPPSAWLFFLTVLLATVTPGPSMLLALDHGVRFGTRRALATALGNVCGTALQCAISLAGLGLVLVKLGWAFAALRLLGAAYLAWLGATMLLRRRSAAAMHRSPIRGSLFTEALVVTLGNPKAILFFTALFPQFVSGRDLSPERALLLTGTTLTVTFVSMLLYAAAGERLQRVLSDGGWRQWFDRAVGAAFIGLGVGLALERR